VRGTEVLNFFSTDHPKISRRPELPGGGNYRHQPIRTFFDPPVFERRAQKSPLNFNTFKSLAVETTPSFLPRPELYGPSSEPSQTRCHSPADTLRNVALASSVLAPPSGPRGLFFNTTSRDGTTRPRPPRPTPRSPPSWTKLAN
jgi:hypothetical protein